MVLRLSASAAARVLLLWWKCNHSSLPAGSIMQICQEINVYKKQAGIVRLFLLY
jgi:hypothetical protein